MDSCLGLCNAIRCEANTLDREFNAALSGEEVSHCQAMVLLELGGGTDSASDLSKTLHCSCGNISQILDLLAAKSMVERQPSAEDRRRSRIVLTAKGRKLYQQAKRALGARAEHCCSVFTPA